MTANQTDTRLEALQEEIDQVRRRLHDNPGLRVADPDVKPVYPAEDSTDEVPPAGTV